MHGVRDVPGPDVLPLDELGRITLAARGDSRTVVTDASVGPFAAASGDALIATTDSAHIAAVHCRSWLDG
ncbi:hypothetical protein [Streptomyces cinerochromogenes]|uniref:hypothetical protein n=1 Tax=Streptomyces cinerochromogenes TaxID=66422 RepID=UPI003F5403FC